MKEKISDIVSRYLLLNLAFLPVLVVLRALEYHYLHHAPDLQETGWALELTGLLYDFRAFLIFALVMFLLYLPVSLLHKKAGIVFYSTLLCLVTLLHFSLIRYFAINLVPLDDILFGYSYREIIMIIRSSDNLNFLSFLPFLLLLTLVTTLQVIFTRIRINLRGWIQLGIVYLLALFIGLVGPRVNDPGEPESRYSHKVNKTYTFLRAGVHHFIQDKRTPDEKMIAQEIREYQMSRPEFDYTSNAYPLMHRARAGNVLGPFFALKEQPPNLVFIIVESLSTACIGNQSWFGNFTPFLDSLRNHSLYWDNFLSISERTFHVFPALFGSLPFGSGEFLQDLGRIPFHYSLIRYLKENGYHTGIYYGGDLTFTNYDQFFKKQGTDLLLQKFGPAYEKKKKLYPDFYWGYHDEETFAWSLEVIDSLKKEPRLDIYLTLSTHHPFSPPRAAYYLQEYDRIISQPGYPPEKRKRSDPNRNLFSSLLYTDDALRSFFRAYAQREDFDNTIFLITGDHFFMELGYFSVSAIERYHVPLIIYSPLIKKPHQFHSVSSHLDITPSLIALLQERYSFRGLPFVHWLGRGIDTTREFRNIHTIQFVTSNQEYLDYLDKDYYLSKDRLYRIGPGLKTQKVDDDGKLAQLRQDLHTTTIVHKYATGTNHILFQQLFMPMKFDTSQLCSFAKAGMVQDPDPRLYLNLIPPVLLDTNFRQLGYDLKFQYRIEGCIDTTYLPWLVLSVEDTSFQNLLYHRIVFPGTRNGPFPGQWSSFHSNNYLDISSLPDVKGAYLKCYFFNRNFCKLNYDSVIFILNGIN